MAKPFIYIGETPAKGRGVFTSRRIKADTVIERAQVVVISAEDRILIDQTILYNYIFEWQPGEIKQCCMALGIIPIFNHSYQSNCEYYMEYEKTEMFVKTIRDIEAGEELTINYNGTWNDETKIWFDVV
jgi:uncharacterized protein